MKRKLYTLCGADTTRPFSPHSWKVVMALHHKGLDFEEAPTAFTAIGGIENGVSKTVPVLSDDGKNIADSFMIAAYLEDAYPDAPSLFGGPGGEAMARFVERWSQLTIHAALLPIILTEIHDCLGPEDQAYFRQDREKRFGKTLEAVAADRDAALARFPGQLAVLRNMLTYQPFIGGSSPLFCDYIVFGALQWARVTSPVRLLPADDPVSDWFERCLDLFDGAGRAVPAAS